MKDENSSSEAEQEDDATRLYVKEQSRATGRFIGLALVVLLLLGGLNWLYTHYAYVRYFRPGVAHLQDRQYVAAEDDFRRYLHLENDPDGHYFLAKTLLGEGKQSAARAEFLRDVLPVPPSKTQGPGGILNARSAAYLHRM